MADDIAWRFIGLERQYDAKVLRRPRQLDRFDEDSPGHVRGLGQPSQRQESWSHVEARRCFDARATTNAAADVKCLTLACAIALLPALGTLFYIARAAPARPVRALLVTGAGCVALGAAVAQLGCPNLALRHLMLAHALAPAIGAALLAYPLHRIFRRLRPL